MTWRVDERPRGRIYLGSLPNQERGTVACHELLLLESLPPDERGGGRSARRNPHAPALANAEAYLRAALLPPTDPHERSVEMTWCIRIWSLNH